MVSAILLAAGESKRMGGVNKLLLPFGSSTILEQAVDTLLNSKLDDVIVVLGYGAKEIRKLITSRSVTIVVNPDFCEGMSTSIVAGLKVINDNAHGIMLALADQPLTDSLTINKLLGAFAASNKGIIMPVYHGERGHPIIFANRYKDALSGLKGDIGGREIIGQHLNDTLEVNVNCKGVCVDIDILSLIDTNAVVKVLCKVNCIPFALAFGAFADVFAINKKSHLPIARCSDPIDFQRFWITRN